ncbi:MAG TPA: DUF3592 domain-containing protein, partial [Candidatus Berkiella sp.]|nr:DUF3592 domain-containing protein [Candidatus Berkiella sp.]
CEITAFQDNKPIYRYQSPFSIHEYVGKNIDLFPAGITNDKQHTSLFDKYPIGKRVICYVNPHDPAQSVLERNWYTQMWYTLFPVFFTFVFIVLFIIGPKSKNKKSFVEFPRYFYLSPTISNENNLLLLSVITTIIVGVTIALKAAEDENAILFVLFSLLSVISALIEFYHFLTGIKFYLKTKSKRFSQGATYTLIYQIEGDYKSIKILTFALVCKKVTYIDIDDEEQHVEEKILFQS